MSVFGYAAFCRFCNLVGVFRERMAITGKYWKTAHRAPSKIIRRATEATGGTRSRNSAFQMKLFIAVSVGVVVLVSPVALDRFFSTRSLGASANALSYRTTRTRRQFA